jgi:Putative transmembrane protein (PGPGW)
VATSTSRVQPVRGRHTAEPAAAHRPSLGQLIRREWKDLRGDEPGQRFRHHYERLHRPQYRKLRMLALFVGPFLAVGGVVMLFIPGPGLLFIVFGLALLGGQSTKLAGWLDRGEPPVRRGFSRLRARWKKLRPRP